MEKYKRDFILLAEAGFIAINQMDEDSANKLFEAAGLLDATNALPKIGMGYLHIHKLELKKAIQLFEEVLKKEPNNMMATALLGLAKTMTSNQAAEGEKLLVKAGKSSEKEIKELSHVALDFVDKFLKKPGGPAHVKKKHK